MSLNCLLLVSRGAGFARQYGQPIPLTCSSLANLCIVMSFDNVTRELGFAKFACLRGADYVASPVDFAREFHVVTCSSIANARNDANQVVSKPRPGS